MRWNWVPNRNAVSPSRKLTWRPWHESGKTSETTKNSDFSQNSVVPWVWRIWPVLLQCTKIWWNFSTEIFVMSGFYCFTYQKGQHDQLVWSPVVWWPEGYHKKSTRPGKHTKNDGKIHRSTIFNGKTMGKPLGNGDLYGKIHHAINGNSSTISTGPCSIARFLYVYQRVQTGEKHEAPYLVVHPSY